MNARLMAVAVALGALLAGSARGGFLLEIDTDGLDDGVLTYNTGFSFGGDTTTASQSAPSSAFGMTGGDSIFGGDGNADPDTYVYTYSPASQADNLVIPAGTDLGNGVLATGTVGGGTGTYNIYATWPFTSNVSGGPTTYEIATAGDAFSIQIDQNDKGNTWIPLGAVNYTSGPITVTQHSDSNTFVSMRGAGLLFEAPGRQEDVVPEPATLALLGLAACGLGGYVRRRKRA